MKKYPLIDGKATAPKWVNQPPVIIPIGVPIPDDILKKLEKDNKKTIKPGIGQEDPGVLKRPKK